ncbi:hypothetical protein C5167_044511 [Papaver somniferum]|uniref:Uncharacterized protein n=1 Tax=Papaver somniferum TaxID=3469 RepID=A0A4Y7LCC0_PAPSO|nr:hypothetical protein C5167_044511 [Papaver somniferum]
MDDDRLNKFYIQPRRISSMEVSEIVAAERGEKLGEIVGYKVCLEGQRGRDTRLLFCTIGILLRRLLHDKSLKGVTHVIVDKIHEHGMNEVTALGKHHYMVGTPLKICKRGSDAGSSLPSVTHDNLVGYNQFLGLTRGTYQKEVARKDDAGNVIFQCKSNWLHFITVYLHEVNGKMMLLVVYIPRGSRWN